MKVFDKVGWGGVERNRQSNEDEKAGIALSQFDPSHVGQVDASAESQLLLRELSLLPQARLLA